MPNGEPRVRSHQTPWSSANSLGLTVPAGHAHHCLMPNLSEPASCGLVPQIIRTRVGPTPRAPWTVADCEIDLRPGVSSELLSGSHHRDLQAVDRRQRVEEATPFLAAIATDPELAGRGAEVERGRAKVIDVHRVPQDREVALLLRQSACEPLPRAAAVLAAPDRGGAARASARHRFEWHDVDRVSVVRVHHDREAEIGWQSLRNRPPRLAVVVAAQDTDVRPRPSWPIPIGPATVVLHVKPSGRGWV